MHLSNRARNAWRCNDVSHAPARDAECLRHPIHDDRALAHPVQGDRRDMFGVVVDNVLVNLVCDGKDIPFLAQFCDELELLAAEYLTCRVIWGVDNNGFGLVIKGRSKFLFIK